MKKDYTLTDLLQDDEYIQWVKFGLPSEKWNAWIHEDTDHLTLHKKARAVLLGIHLDENEPLESAISEVWKRIETHTNKEQSNETIIKKQYPFWKHWLAAAASIALLIGVLTLVFINQQNDKVYVAMAGDHKTVILPDGSVAELNAGSKLKFNPKQWKKKRKITLKGEAFFDVIPSPTPFIVTTPQTVTRVLGTTFNVHDRANHAEVKCYSGNVNVLIDNANTNLMMGEYVRINDKAKAVKDRFDPKVKNWKDGVFHFWDRPLASVIEELERQFDVEVHLVGKIEATSYTGSFQSGNLDLALQSICWPLNLTYQVKENHVEIHN